jgi:catechol 2,3-dioxygenase-like lactoylglutathione lyase family enzyme
VTSPTPPVVECEKAQARLAVSDLAAAIEFYVKKLGFQFGFRFGEPARFAGLNLGNVGIFLNKGVPAPSAGAVFFTVNDTDALYEFHRANGVEVVEEIVDRELRMRDYVVKDLYGYRLIFGHNISL